MKKGVTWIILTCSIVVSLVLASCTTNTSTPTSIITPSSTSTTNTTSTTIKTTVTTVSTTKPVTTASGNWWDKLGKPQYGGEIVLRTNSDISVWDPYLGGSNTSVMQGWMEKLTSDNWTVDPTIFNYHISFRPPEYEKGSLAESWEFPDPSTYLIHLRQGIHWQNITPVNGREFTADDVVFHYNRFTGKGDGFTKPCPYYATAAIVTQMKSVTASDKYTVVFNWNTPNQEAMVENLQSPSNQSLIENKEAVQQWGDLNDWHHSVGTGPFTIKDFVIGSSATLIKNPNYWGYDERYPQNQLPYVDKITYLVIPDNATALAAMRTGKIDAMDKVTAQQALQAGKTNPEILQFSTPSSNATTIDPRNDVKPFNDIRVRKAMQMAIDLPTIASTYYGGYVSSPYPATLTSRDMTGWGWPYDNWPQDLKDEYTYNPTAAKKLLADAGYPNGFNTDVVADSSSDMDLLQIAKAYFSQIGINMDIRTMDPASWTAYVTAMKHDQLATKGGALGAMYEPMRQLSMLITNTEPAVNDPNYTAIYQRALASTTVAQVKQALRDANELIARQHYLISLLTPTTYTLCQPWLKGYNGQDRSILTANVFPAFLNFYGARIWIDQNLKKSMGH